MGEGDGRGQEPDPAGGEIDVPEGGRGEQQRVHRRADVVAEAGQRQLGGAAAASGLVGSLVDVDRQAGAGQEERSDQPVGTGTHDDGIRAPSSAGHSAQGQRLRGPDDWHRALGEAAQRPLDLGVGALRPMVEERHPARPRHGPRARPRTRRPHGRTTLRPPPPRTGGGRRGSGGRRRGPARAPPRGTRRCLRARVRAPSGSGRGCRRRDEWPSLTRKPDGVPALVGDIEGADAEALGRRRCRRERGRTASRRGARDGAIGKKGGDIMRASSASASVVARPGPAGAGVTARVLAITAGEEGQPLHVVPVQVGQEDGAPERAVTEELGQAPQARAGVEEQRGRRRIAAVVRQRDARGVPAEADEVGTRCGRRPPGPAERDAHRFSLARGPRGDAPRTAPPDASAR